MKQQDLLASVTISQDFPGKAMHCNTFFFSISPSQVSAKYTLWLWQKLQVTQLASCRLSSSLSIMLQCLVSLVSHSSFLHRFRQIPTKNLARKMHWRWLWFLSDELQGFSPAPDLQQMPRLLKVFGQTKTFCRFRKGSFSFLGKMELFLSFLGRFFSFSLPNDFFLLFIFP